MAFIKGTSGNPSGRPIGVQTKTTALRKLLDPHAEELLGKLVEMAKDGNMNAMRLVVERLLPPQREGHITLELPDITTITGCAEAQAKILSAVASGELLSSEGQALSGLVENRRKAIESTEILERLTALEEKL